MRVSYFNIFLLLAVITLATLWYKQATHHSAEVQENAETQAGRVVNVYSSRKEELMKGLFDQFTEVTGIKVRFITGKAPALISRIQSEGAYTEADLFITADFVNLAEAKDAGILEPIASEILMSAVPEHLRDPDQTWFGLSKRVRAIVYAKDRVTPQMLSTYEDLADEKWKQKILVRSSTNPYNQSLIASMIYADGVEQTKRWASGIVRNMARAPQGGDVDQMTAVASGEGDLAIVNSYYFGRLQNSSVPFEQEAAQKLAIFFPNQNDRGTHVNISGGAIIQQAKHKREALELLEFLVSDQAQKIYAEMNQEFPIKSTVPVSEIISEWGTFVMDAEPISKLAAHRKEALHVADSAGWR